LKRVYIFIIVILPVYFIFTEYCMYWSLFFHHLANTETMFYCNTKVLVLLSSASFQISPADGFAATTD